MTETDTPGLDPDLLGDATAVGDELVRLLRIVAASRARQRTDPSDPVPDGGDRLLLGRLVYCGGRRATDLAADTHLDLSTVSRQIRSLVQRGLVERRADPDDRRGVLLTPTEAGHAAFAVYRRRRDERLAAVLADWPAADRAHLARLLGLLNDGIAAHELEPPTQADAPPHQGGPPV
ncbi:MarR family winged helix-turn-helix transcriptional regulator [Yinghuangia seranimata]|uniref:MarR family winged helix-turn-helix transcriptional regulator n=1 Tax=Yinghuangia seranimata TaxID=408067 RepID=UPI00248CDF16|nr:MarR family winged helix-turn-helix transcriptional regulator [Yinghuangia seranimata]MDI2125577.1 MarR family winged helix-turn-helix transcriptional regulator [Yinghuangia seranimata]